MHKMELITQKVILMNKMNEVKTEITELKKANPWYPTYSLNAMLTGYTKRLKRLENEIRTTPYKSDQR